MLPSVILYVMATVSGPAAAQSSVPVADEAVVLAELPAEEILAEAPRIVELALRAHGLDQLPARLSVRLRTEVLTDLAGLDLVGHWRRGLAALPAQTLAEARQLLAQPAVEKLREAATSPADAEQWRQLRQYRDRLEVRPPAAGRTALMARIVDAHVNAELAALLQTGVERLLLDRAAAAGVTVNRPRREEWAWIASERLIARREAQIQYSFFSYRYLSDAVLESYLATVEHGALARVNQTLADVARAQLLPR